MQAGNGSYSEEEKQNRNSSVSRQVSPYNNQGEDQDLQVREEALER